MRMVSVREDVLEELIKRVTRLERWRDQVVAAEYTPYKGTKSSDFTTGDLPDEGDYGFMEGIGGTANTVQMNCGGGIRYWPTTAVP